MKYKTTQKAVLNGYNTVISVPYCELQTMLGVFSPVAYTANQYGWRADVYQFGNTAIVTGYGPFGKKVPFETIRKYEQRAWQIRNSTFDYVRQMTPLVEEFIKEVS